MINSDVLIDSLEKRVLNTDFTDWTDPFLSDWKGWNGDGIFAERIFLSGPSLKATKSVEKKYVDLLCHLSQLTLPSMLTYSDMLANITRYLNEKVI